MGFRFIHAADIHLDSPLRGLSAYENAPAQQLRNASREALKELVTKAIEDSVSFVVFAGDLYDGDWRDYNTGIFFAMQMGRLAKAGIRAFVLHGNHDAESEMTKKLVLPDNVIVFSSRSAQVHKIDDLKVALHGQSFANRATEENLAASYKAKVSDHFNIGVLHTALQGYAAHANYAPCTVDELHSKTMTTGLWVTFTNTRSGRGHRPSCFRATCRAVMCARRAERGRFPSQSMIRAIRSSSGST
jgi:DNA repair protein SbcD/Mre11